MANLIFLFLLTLLIVFLVKVALFVISGGIGLIMATIFLLLILFWLFSD